MKTNIIEQINSLFNEMKKLPEHNSQAYSNILIRISYVVNRGGPEGIRAYIKGILTNPICKDYPNETSIMSRDLIAKHKLAFATAVRGLPEDLKPQYLKYLKELKTFVVKNK